jgi:hypothetical protein
MDELEQGFHLGLRAGIVRAGMLDADSQLFANLFQCLIVFNLAPVHNEHLRFRLNACQVTKQGVGEQGVKSSGIKEGAEFAINLPLNRSDRQDQHRPLINESTNLITSDFSFSLVLHQFNVAL